MPQICRPAAPSTRNPPAVTPRICALVRPVPIPAIMIQQQVYLFLIHVIQVRRWPLHAALNNRIVASGSCPGAEEAVGGDFGEDCLFGFVFHKADEVFPGGVEREESQVDDVGRGFVD